jgi:hypothetical protein
MALHGVGIGALTRDESLYLRRWVRYYIGQKGLVGFRTRKPGWTYSTKCSSARRREIRRFAKTCVEPKL